MTRKDVLTGARALAVLGTALVIASTLAVWGPDAAVAAGPPPNWERAVTGALLFCTAATVALFFARKRIAARVVALVAAVGAMAVALLVWNSVRASIQPNHVEGRGFALLGLGAVFALSASLAALLGSRSSPDKRPTPQGAGQRKARRNR